MLSSDHQLPYIYYPCLDINKLLAEIRTHPFNKRVFKCFKKGLQGRGLEFFNFKGGGFGEKRIYRIKGRAVLFWLLS